MKALPQIFSKLDTVHCPQLNVLPAMPPFMCWPGIQIRSNLSFFVHKFVKECCKIKYGFHKLCKDCGKDV